MNPKTSVYDDLRVQLAEEDDLRLQEWLLLFARNPSDDKDMWLLSGMLRAAQRSFGHLRRACGTDESYAAWACRNLFDLRVLVRFVTRSVDHRRRFLYQWIVKVQEPGVIGQSGVRSGNQQGASGSSVESIEDKLDGLWARVRQVTLTNGSHFNTFSLASEVGLSEEFRKIHAMTGRRIHPSAQSILPSGVDDADVMDQMMIAGCQALSAIVADAALLAEEIARRVQPESDEETFVRKISFPARDRSLEMAKKDPHRRVEEFRRYSRTF